MKLKARNKWESKNSINYKGHWIINSDRGLTLGDKQTTEDQAHVCNLLELSKVREWLGTEWSVEVVL